MDAGTLQLKLMADITDLVSKMGDAKREVNGSMDTMSNAFGLAKTAFVGLVGVGSVGAFAGMIKGSIDTTGALKDMSIQTGASEAALNEFRRAGAYTETGMDSITTMLNKMGKNMVMGGEDTKGAGIAIKALGLDFDTIKAMKPEDQMLAIAGSLNKFADGADKGTAANAIFGKGAEKNLPFLKDLADAAEGLTTKLTDQEIALQKTQAAMADAFGDNLTALQKNTVYMKEDIANGMTPALWAASEAFLGVANQSGGLKDTITRLSKDGSITAWTNGAITGLTYVMDAFSGVAAVAKSTGLVVAGIAAAATSGSWEGMKAAINAMGEDLDKTWGEKTLGAQLRERMTDIKNVGIVSEAAKPNLDVSDVLKKSEAARLAEKEATKAQEAATKSLNAELKKQEDQYNKLTSSIDEKILSMEQTMEKGEKLTDAEKIENKLLADMASSTVILTDKQLDNVLSKINQLKAVEEHAEAVKKEKKEIEESTKLTADMIDKLQKETNGIEAASEKQREHSNTIFLSKEELILLSAQKDIDTASTLLRNAAIIENGGSETAITAEWRKQATALTTLAGLKEQGIHVQAAKDAYIEWEKTSKSIGTGLSSALVDATLSGKDIWTAFRDFMVKTIIDGVLKKAIASVITDALSGVNTSIGGMLSSMFSTAVGKTGGSAVAGSVGSSAAGSTLGSAGSSLLGSGSMSAGASVIGGSMSLANGAGSVAANLTGTGLDGLLAMNGAYGTAGAAGSGAAGAGAASGGIGGLGTLGTAAAAVAAMYVTKLALDQIMGFGGTNTSLGSRQVQGKGTYFDQNWGENGILRDLSNVTVTKERTTKGEILYQAYEGDSGWPIGRQFGTLAEVGALIGATIPEFAGGGAFGGGMRIVGERGPELEVTGPSRIFDAATTASMLRSGGASGADLADEMRLLREEVQGLRSEARATASHTAKTARLLDRAMPDGDAIATREVTA